MSFFLRLYKVKYPFRKALLRLALLLTMICGGTAAATASEQKVQTMTLAEAVTLALGHNRSVESAYLDRLLEQFDLKTAQDKFLPDARIFSSVLQENMIGESSYRTEIGGKAALKVPTGGEFSLTWTQPVHSSASDQLFDNFGNNVVLSFTQPLLKGGGIQVNRADQVLAEYAEEHNVLRLQDILTATITQVVYAYRSFLLAQRGLEINRLSFKRSRELLERNRILIEEGRKARVDIIETEANVANQELRFLISQNDVDTKRMDLLRLLDIDRHIVIQPTEAIKVEPVELKQETLLQIALKNHSEYRQALIALNTAQTNLLLAENQQYWQLDLEGQYNVTDSKEYAAADAAAAESDRAGDYRIAMKLEIPFGDESRKRELLKAKADYRKAKIAVQELKENIAISVQDMYQDINMKWQQIELAQKARDLAQKQLDVELEKFKNDKSSNFQVVTYQGRLIEAEHSENREKVAYLNALTELDMYLGTTLEHWGIDLASAGKVKLP